MMPNQPEPGEDLRVVKARVYFDTSTGEVIHIHQLAAGKGQELPATEVEMEMGAFEEHLRTTTSSSVDFVDVEPTEIIEGAVRRVDPVTKTISR